MLSPRAVTGLVPHVLGKIRKPIYQRHLYEIHKHSNWEKSKNTMKHERVYLHYLCTCWTKAARAEKRYKIPVVYIWFHCLQRLIPNQPMRGTWNFKSFPKYTSFLVSLSKVRDCHDSQSDKVLQHTINTNMGSKTSQYRLLTEHGKLSFIAERFLRWSSPSKQLLLPSTPYISKLQLSVAEFYR